METTEKIVESWCRYVKKWFTVSNIPCKGNNEIDLIAVDLSQNNGLSRYHIETTISTSNEFSKLTARPFSKESLRQRSKQAAQRTTIGFFIEKFQRSDVIEKLMEYGFKQDNYKKCIVVWDWTEDAQKEAENAGISLYRFSDILQDIKESCIKGSTYFRDDTLRTIQLYEKGLLKSSRNKILKKLD